MKLYQDQSVLGNLDTEELSSFARLRRMVMLIIMILFGTCDLKIPKLVEEDICRKSFFIVLVKWYKKNTKALSGLMQRRGSSPRKHV